MPNIIF